MHSSRSQLIIRFQRSLGNPLEHLRIVQVDVRLASVKNEAEIPVQKRGSRTEKCPILEVEYLVTAASKIV